jgi:hypothetical protein
VNKGASYGNGPQDNLTISDAEMRLLRESQENFWEYI